MKQLLLPILLLIGLSLPCEAAEKVVTVPSSQAADFVNEDTYSSSSAESFIVLVNGGIGIISGANDTIVIQKGASATIMGDNSKVYVFNGGAATIMSKGNTIYHEKNASINTVDEDINKDILVTKFISDSKE